MAEAARTNEYYDEEARLYSGKRYPAILRNYVHFLFTRRRTLALGMLGKAIAGTIEPRTLLEVGCADGILLRSIAAKYRGAFQSMMGVDISKPMVETARTLTPDPSITYKLRDELLSAGSYSVVLEIGVAALAFDTKGEVEILANQLAQGGYLLCSFATSTSLAVLLSRGSAGDNSILRPYTEYEKVLQQQFTIVSSKAYGLYVPLVWKVPALARLLQPAADMLCALVPSLAHEQLYLLKKK
jgi:SAM-dependent methyltransferase